VRKRMACESNLSLAAGMTLNVLIQVPVGQVSVGFHLSIDQR
jgi:hypothetical protein